MRRAPVSLASTGIEPASVAARFWAKVRIGAADECWPWQGSTNRGGYGLFSVGSRCEGSRRTLTASRLAFELHFGRALEGLALHGCDNPPCCNPGHLFDGDDAANAADRARKGRSSVGSRQGAAKLTEEIVREARSLFGFLDVRQLANKYAVSHPTMWKAVHGQTWKHVR